MANEKNLRPKPFTTENQPANRGRKPGVPNRATVLKKFLSTKVEVDNPNKSGEKVKLTLYEIAALGQLRAAAEGNTQAWKEIQDSLHGKIPDKVENSGEITIATRVIEPGE